MWFNLLVFADKSLWNLPSVMGRPRACLMDDPYAHRRPSYKGCSFSPAWSWWLLRTSLELVQFLAHHHFQWNNSSFHTNLYTKALSNGLKWTKWTELDQIKRIEVDQIDRNRPNGPKRTEKWTKVDRSRSKCYADVTQ